MFDVSCYWLDRLTLACRGGVYPDDGSLMNGLQSLTQWENDFNNPTGGMLGLLNAIQVSQVTNN